MANETFVTVRGNVARDPERRQTQSGTWARFSMGVTSRVRDGDNGYKDRPTQWFEVRVYGTQAENVCDSVGKGSPVLVRGELRTDTWTSEGVERSMQYIRADTVALDLHFRAYSVQETSRDKASQAAPEVSANSSAFGSSEPASNTWGHSSPAPMGEYSAPVA